MESSCDLLQYSAKKGQIITNTNIYCDIKKIIFVNKKKVRFNRFSTFFLLIYRNKIQCFI